MSPRGALSAGASHRRHAPTSSRPLVFGPSCASGISHRHEPRCDQQGRSEPRDRSSITRGASPSDSPTRSLARRAAGALRLGRHSAPAFQARRRLAWLARALARDKIRPDQDVLRSRVRGLSDRPVGPVGVSKSSLAVWLQYSGRPLSGRMNCARRTRTTA
jgi:hypothetical protein